MRDKRCGVLPRRGSVHVAAREEVLVLLGLGTKGKEIVKRMHHRAARLRLHHDELCVVGLVMASNERKVSRSFASMKTREEMAETRRKQRLGHGRPHGTAGPDQGEKVIRVLFFFIFIFI
ncbi:hypothetical protein B296_00029061 [Ensete ventricosum]|uniref:Uncharacterized protein n=1 Tax=Ensete ventricosum TaxID=4639 RepID=A0A427ALV7_ENSVE|nr:hypothetical protein B296_00029061 [Ensete ventricosum]